MLALVIISGTTILALELRKQALANAQQFVTALSQITAEQTAQSFLAADLLLRSVQDLARGSETLNAATLRIRGQTPEFRQSLMSLQRLLPQVATVGILGVDGIVISTSRTPALAALDLSATEPFRSLRDKPDKGLAIDGPSRSAVNGQWMLYLGRALRGSDGGFVGVAIVGIPIAYFETKFSTVAIGPKGSVALTSDDLRMIARWPEVDDAIGTRIGGPSPPAFSPDGTPRFAVIQGIDGRLRVGADTRLQVPGVPLHVAVTQAESVSLKPWRGMLFAIGGSVGTALVVLAALTVFALRWLSGEARWRNVLVDRDSRLSRQAADLIVARDLAQDAQRARGQFLANMSHELRTPLNAVMGFSDLFRHEMLGPLGNPKYREFAEDIHQSGKHLLDIVNNILDLTKIDTGKLELAHDDVDVATLMDFCGKMVADLARSADVALEIVPPTGALNVHGDPIRLRQILLNLLSNAIKFTPAGGCVSLAGEQVGDELVLQVTDTGIGMSAEETAKVMQPFYQVDNSTTRRYQGTGLGLPLTKSLVELHGGRIEIESAPGAGTRVTIHLP